MGLTGWVTTHTGLPAFYATGNGKLTADHPLLGAELPRLIAVVDGACLVADPGAPAGVPTTYRFGSQTVTLTRKGEAAATGGVEFTDGLTDVNGNEVAGVGIVWGDPREYETGAKVFTSALGRQIPRFPLGQAPPTGTLELVTTREGTERLRVLAAAHTPLWVIHNGAACSRPDCDIEGSRLIVIHRVSEVMSQRRTRAQRNWKVDYSRVPTDLAGSGVQAVSGGPVVTWGQWEAWGVGREGYGVSLVSGRPTVMI